MKVLVIGSGGREHAIAWKVTQSQRTTEVFVAPGNAGTALLPKCKNINLKAEDSLALKLFALDNQIDLTIVGPEAPLVTGIVDLFQKAGLQCFGPSQACAQLEGSKAFCKNFLFENHIPTAHYQLFDNFEQAKGYIKKQSLPLVIKADGLAAGKGVIIAQTEIEAIEAARKMLCANEFGDAGNCIVIEQFLTGPELSFIALVDGKTILPLASSQDHKARDNGNRGPNTGGMGAYSPSPLMNDILHSQIMSEVMEPVVEAMNAQGTPYVGFLYAGLMITDEGPYVLEFNCRFGDPETQPILMRLQSDLVTMIEAACHGELSKITAEWDPRPALGVVLASHGYPGAYEKGYPIQGLPKGETDNSSMIFHAGTLLDESQVITNGGRVLCATALGDTIEAAKSNAYQVARKIEWPGVFYRTDIGDQAIITPESELV